MIVETAILTKANQTNYLTTYSPSTPLPPAPKSPVVYLHFAGQLYGTQPCQTGCPAPPGLHRAGAK